MDPKADSKRILDGFKKDQKQIQKEFVSLNSGSVAKKVCVPKIGFCEKAPRLNMNTKNHQD